SWQKWCGKGNKNLRHFALSLDPMPRKHAGVGLARKIGMDEAVDRLLQAENPSGLVVGLDADCSVSPNYLQALSHASMNFPKKEAFSLNFTHPLKGDEFSPEIYAAITDYELYLRFYVEALRWAGHPHAFHCIGSSMAVRADAYQARGGMNRRKAGEDFYFLQKFIQEGTLAELNETTVYPAPRASHRVPFGTGKAVQTLLDQDTGQTGFAWESFIWLKNFIHQIPHWYRHDPEIHNHSLTIYLIEKGWLDKIKEIRSQVKTEAAFVKRFYKWFNGLRVLQYLHEARKVWPDTSILTSTMHLFAARKWHLDSPSQLEALLFLRHHQGQ
ncbi:MAG: hypothetical protein AAFV07_20780, partial [Bacteroidota bacterium]